MTWIQTLSIEHEEQSILPARYYNTRTMHLTFVYIISCYLLHVIVYIWLFYHQDLKLSLLIRI